MLGSGSFSKVSFPCLWVSRPSNTTRHFDIYYVWSTGEETVVSTTDSSQEFARMAFAPVWNETKQLSPPITWMQFLRWGAQLFFSEGWVTECLLLANTHPGPCLPLQASVNEPETHSECLLTTTEKWCYYLDTWGRQSLQNHFINNILEPARKYILQTTITIVSFGKWILNFYPSPSETFPQMQCMFLLPCLNGYGGLKWWRGDNSLMRTNRETKKQDAKAVINYRFW